MMVLTAAGAHNATAQVPGAAVPQGDLHAGIMWKEIDPNVQYGDFEERFTQSGYAVVFRYGATSIATVSIELSGDQNWLGLSEDSSTYTFGAGLQATIWEHQSWAIVSSVHYARMFEVVHIEGECNYDEVEIDALLTGQYQWRTRSGNVTPWLGPAISYFSASAQPPCPYVELEAIQEFGVVVGVDWVDGHFVAGAHTFWLDEFQPRLILAWRF
jgi:hypothetical protein